MYTYNRVSKWVTVYSIFKQNNTVRAAQVCWSWRSGLPLPYSGFPFTAAVIGYQIQHIDDPYVCNLRHHCLYAISQKHVHFNIVDSIRDINWWSHFSLISSYSLLASYNVQAIYRTLLSRSSSRWDSCFPFYVLRIYVRIYWSWELVFF